jgi:hypothetical protein
MIINKPGIVWRLAVPGDSSSIPSSALIAWTLAIALGLLSRSSTSFKIFELHAAGNFVQPSLTA